MLISKFKLNQLRFNRKKFGNEIELAGNMALASAAAAFVIKADERLPVFTGMAKSSLRPLADRVGIDLDTTPVAAAKRKDDMYKTSEGNLIALDRQAEGEALSSHVLFAPRNQYGPLAFIFEFSTDVPHWAGPDPISLEYDEDDKNNRKAEEQPWKAMETGFEEFEATFQNEFERVYTRVASGDYLRTVEQSNSPESTIGSSFRLSDLGNTPF